MRCATCGKCVWDCNHNNPVPMSAVSVSEVERNYLERMGHKLDFDLAPPCTDNLVDLDAYRRRKAVRS